MKNKIVTILVAICATFGVSFAGDSQSTKLAPPEGAVRQIGYALFGPSKERLAEEAAKSAAVSKTKTVVARCHHGSCEERKPAIRLNMTPCAPVAVPDTPFQLDMTPCDPVEQQVHGQDIRVKVDHNVDIEHRVHVRKHVVMIDEGTTYEGCITPLEIPVDLRATIQPRVFTQTRPAQTVCEQSCDQRRQITTSGRPDCRGGHLLTNGSRCGGYSNSSLGPNYRQGLYPQPRIYAPHGGTDNWVQYWLAGKDNWQREATHNWHTTYAAIMSR